MVGTAIDATNCCSQDRFEGLNRVGQPRQYWPDFRGGGACRVMTILAVPRYGDGCRSNNFGF